MQTFINLTPFVTGLFLVTTSLLSETKNLQSALVYRVIPFFFGLACMFSGAKLMGWI